MACNTYEQNEISFHNVSEFTDDLHNLLSISFKSESYIIITRDVNMNLLVISNIVSKLSKMFLGLFFTYLITRPTRVTINSRTLLNKMRNNKRSPSSYIKNNKQLINT